MECMGTCFKNTLRKIVRFVTIVCGAATLFFAISLAVVPLLSISNDIRQVEVGIAIQVQNLIICLLAMYVCWALERLLTGRMEVYESIYRVFSFFSLAFIAEMGLSYVCCLFSGESVATIVLTLPFSAFPSYPDWYRCLETSLGTNAVVFRIDIWSAIVALVFGIVSQFMTWKKVG